MTSPMIASAPPHAPPADPAAAAEAAGRLLDRLEELSAEQAAALAGGDDDRLLVVLGEKQAALDAVDLRVLLRAAGPAAAPGLRRRVAALVESDGESLAAAAARRDELAGELSAMGAASAARGAYGGGSPAAKPRRLDIAG